MEAEKKSGPSQWIAIGISITSLVLSSLISLTTLFYTQLYTSEALYGLVLNYRYYDKTWAQLVFGLVDGEKEQMIADLVLINKGNQNVIVSSLEFFFPRQEGGGVPITALKVDTDEDIHPLLIEPREVKYVKARHRFGRIPASIGRPTQFPGPHYEGAVDLPISLRFVTVGSSSEIQSSEITLGIITLRDSEFIQWARATREAKAVRVRK